MQTQKLFRSSFIEKLASGVKNQDLIESYSESEFHFPEDEVLINPEINVDKVNFIDPDSDDLSRTDFENAKRLFAGYKDMTPVQASDPRIWTYLCHTTFWEYMKKRWKFDEKTGKELSRHILTHWFVYPLNARNLLRNEIASLWWSVYLTRDEERQDEFYLTELFFKQAEFKTLLLESSLGRNKIFTHAYLEYVTENSDLFAVNRRERYRELMKRMNFISGYKLITALSKEKIKKRMSIYKDKIAQI